MSKAWVTSWNCLVGIAAGLETGRQAAEQRTGGDLVLVAEAPRPDLLAGEPARVGDAARPSRSPTACRERWKTWAMSTRSDPASRASRTFGTQLIVNSGPSAAEPTCCGTTVGPPGTISTVRPSAA